MHTELGPGIPNANLQLSLWLFFPDIYHTAPVIRGRVQKEEETVNVFKIRMDYAVSVRKPVW